MEIQSLVLNSIGDGWKSPEKQKMAAIADLECAICLEEYSADNPGIRTSCCGYHFHHSCLSNCLETNGACPICAAPRSQTQSSHADTMNRSPTGTVHRYDLNDGQFFHIP